MVSVSRSWYWFKFQWLGLALLSISTLMGVTLTPVTFPESAQAQTANSSQALTLRADVQEANAITGVITARGNVQINYPARQIQATAVQAQYYSRERRIVLTGDVYVLQAGNSLRGEIITYLVDEGRFVALPDSGQQVESIYLIQDTNTVSTTTGSSVGSSNGSPTGSTTGTVTEDNPFNPKPEFKAPLSP
ncbi:LptA/OstA family protein [Thermocoleostomius sinensis]|uniref:OstA family protein n=1 Tax=Thermocoleostomius sinensis A174 TaxID=2016057 RepID=A0A9E8ZCV4_9CYAN|nr:OstA family protein [Thermocoleostomius sinensis A174]